MSRFNILLVSPCQGAYGGIEAFVLAVADAVRRDPDFSVRVAFKKTRDFSLRPEFTTMLANEPVEFVERGGGELRRAIQWADLVHLQNASPDVVALTKLLRKRLVLTIHNYMAPGWSLHKFLWRVGARLADARWYNSQFVWNTWEPARKRSGSRKVPTVSRLPTGCTSAEQRRGFAFVGRWIANKGIDAVVDAYQMAGIDRAAWPLVLIGDGPLRADIEAKVSRDATGIELLGFLDTATKAERVRNAKWMVVPPSTNEDFGLTAIEARSVGVPCIATRDGGLPEAAGGQALLCEPRNVEGLARLLEQAAAMSEAEYVERATKTRDELRHELEPLSFYARAYRAVLNGQVID